MTTISVVVCAFNEQDWINATLQSLVTQTRPADEIIVVNNASTDNTANVVLAFASKNPSANLKLITESTKGLHHAREAGWQAATSDIIAVTDADILVPQNWLQKIEAEFANDPQLSAITGILRYQDALPIVNWVTWICDQLYQPERIGKWLGITKEYNLTGGNSAYRRHILEQVGGYKDKPSNLVEDMFVSQKIQRQGFKVKFVRNLKVIHTFRRFNKDGWRGYYKYIFGYTLENVYPDHLADK